MVFPLIDSFVLQKCNKEDAQGSVNQRKKGLRNWSFNQINMAYNVCETHDKPVEFAHPKCLLSRPCSMVSCSF